MKNKAKIILSSLSIIASMLTIPGCNKEKEERTIIETIPPQKNLEISISPSPKIEEIKPIIDPIDVFTEVFQYSYLKYNSYAYDNYRDFNPLFEVEEYQKVFILGTNGIVYNVVFENAQTAYISINDLEIMPTNFIETDLSDHLVNYYGNNILLYSFKVDLGIDENSTDIGYFDVYQIDSERNLCGPGYVQPVHGFIIYNGGEGFHDIILNNGIYYTEGANLSHGCTRMNTEDFYLLNDNVEIGTKVLVHK